MSKGGEYEPKDSRNVTGTAATPDGRWTNTDGSPPRAGGEHPAPRPYEEEAEERTRDESGEDDDEEEDIDEEDPLVAFEPVVELLQRIRQAESRSRSGGGDGDGQTRH